MSQFEQDKIKQKGSTFLPQARKLVQRLKRIKPAHLDQVIMKTDNEVFLEIDCLDCANCCKSLGPLLTDADIRRIAKFLKLSPGQFTETYLRIDDEGDYIFNSMPCPFLDSSNYCTIYEHRPRACREYPHTGQKGFRGRLSLALKNLETCPALQEIMLRLHSTEL